AALPEATLTAAVGPALGQRLRALARNDDPRAVVPERAVKSIGAEETFAVDLATRAACEREVVRLVDRVTARLRQAELQARTVTLKMRYANFETLTRSRTLPAATEVSTLFVATARELLDGLDCGRGVRLLGVSLSGLTPAADPQGVLDLDDVDARADVGVERRAAVERAVDAVRDRYGSRSVGPASLVDGHHRDTRR
ncbi:MAG TPA: DNA polymerase IV, partial [Acidimicrobiia bacterium]|nr:DNA polymerase IV [Acidimicrobiia bacterium]